MILNTGTDAFWESLNSKIYVDKTMLIDYLNERLETKQKYVCVSRPRRFGKSMTAEMLAAYYSCDCDSHSLFDNLKIASTLKYNECINKYNVISLNIVEYFGIAVTVQEGKDNLIKRLLYELKEEYKDVNVFDWNDILGVLGDIYNQTSKKFIFIIDEWDSVFRIHKDDLEYQKIYLDFLRNLLKDKTYVAFTYMTGILPIKKYGEHSALNMFEEYSMTEPKYMAQFTGFTQEEVKALCEQYKMSYEEVKNWYDGYNVSGLSVYNPNSVVYSMLNRDIDSYWTSTETYEALKKYICLNMDGLKDKVTRMIAGEEIEIDISSFVNDMTTFVTEDDVLTLLVHLGYLTYNANTKKVKIPNNEVQREFITSIKNGGWENVIKLIRQSEELLNSTLACQEEKVSDILEQVHNENTSILQYNDENSLSCVVSLAYYAARKDYGIYRELSSGIGYADIVLIPRKNIDKPVIVIELKYNKSTKAAIKQIKDKKYMDCIKGYQGEMLLVGINYDKNSREKKHTCKIERIIK